MLRLSVCPFFYDIKERHISFGAAERFIGNPHTHAVRKPPAEAVQCLLRLLSVANALFPVTLRGASLIVCPSPSSSKLATRQTSHIRISAECHPCTSQFVESKTPSVKLYLCRCAFAAFHTRALRQQRCVLVSRQQQIDPVRHISFIRRVFVLLLPGSRVFSS